MIARLLDVHLRRKAPDDRDDYSNKRVDSAGALMSLLTRQLFRAFLKSISVAQARLVETGKIDSTPFGDVVSDRRISSGFKYAMATGVWNSAKSGLGGSSQTGVAQVVSRMTALSTQSNLRRINTPISREGKCPKPRQLHPTSWGIICASESPEGSGCGLVKNLALLAMVRSGVLSTPIAESILHSSATRVVPLLVATKAERDDGAMVFVNGVTIGFCARADASALVAELRTKRRQQQLPADMSVSHSGRFVLVASDPGALLRPVIIASEVHRFNRVCRETPAYANTFDTLLQAGVIEFLDKDEERDCRIAVRATDLARGGYTHLELDPAAILGVMGNCVPFANHDQAPRVTYQCAMGKQACGVPTTNWLRRMDALSHVQLSPMVPLVSTRAEQALGSESVPSGANIIVCVLAHGGFNQEDSLILNKASVERGLFRTLCHRSIKDEEKQGADREIFENPLTSREPVASMRVGRYDRLESGGFVVAPGAAIERDVCIIAKTISTSDVVAEQNESRTTVKRDKSVLYRHTEPANVDMVLHTRTRDGSRAVRVRTRAVRQPKVGDKFSSRHGQKGVVGQLCDEMQMPYCPRTGLRPDLIVNPHALPSRMTIGQMLEQLLGILCTHTGEIGDGTPFRGTTPQAIGDMLEQAGLQRNGNRMMVDGHTGEQLPMLCFISPCFYQRLKHMSSDKIHARSRGPCQILTRQPLEGRSSQGGLRFGEMERDCLISHGAASVLQEFLLLKSDAFEALLCAKCGLLAVPKDERAHVRHSAAHCRACGSTDCVRKTLPYAMKLLMQELMGMHIGARLRLDQKEAPACEMAATAL